MTHARETIRMLAEQVAVAACALGITIRIIAASWVFGIVHGPDPDRETALSVSISKPSMIAVCWGTLDELQTGLMGIAAMVFWYELHEFTAADDVLVVSYLLLNVGVVAAPGLVQAAQDVLNRIGDNRTVANT